MKPDWDKLANKFSSSDVVTVADVDCTAAGQPICQKVGVSGYPTIKYWLAGNRSAKDYQGGRDYNSLESFTSSTFKAACDPITGKGCNEQEQRYIEKVKPKSAEELATELKEKETELKAAKDERKAAEKEFKEKEKGFKRKEKALTKAVTIVKKFIKEADKKKDEL